MTADEPCCNFLPAFQADTQSLSLAKKSSMYIVLREDSKEDGVS